LPPRRPDDEPAGLPPEWAGFVVPDDLSELDEESRAVRAELHGTRDRIGPRWLLGAWSRRRYEPSGLLVLAVLVVALFFASLGVFLQPSAPRAPAARALAHPTSLPGATEALLPDLAVTVGQTRALRLRSVRPAVLVVLPAQCACGPLVDDVITGTAASRIKVLVIGPLIDPVLPSTVPRSRVTAGADSGGRLAATYQAGRNPIVVFVRSDGTVSRVLHDARPGADLHQEIAGLAH